uniref:WAP domain-containing protein n=1 Tax=Salarias fasciatus TaxID=181472 RepID=A0A672FWV0_SALFA
EPLYETNALLLFQNPGVCPREEPGLVGICVFIPGESCLTDEDCSPELKCCSSGCGKKCFLPCLNSLSEENKHDFAALEQDCQSVSNLSSCSVGPPKPPSHGGGCRDRCSAQKPCPKHLICCSSKCGRVCKVPKIGEIQILCPNNHPLSCSRLRSCHKRCPCPKGWNCCSTKCGKNKCLKPKKGETWTT